MVDKNKEGINFGIGLIILGIVGLIIDKTPFIIFVANSIDTIHFSSVIAILGGIALIILGAKKMIF